MKWIVSDRHHLGGAPRLRGTRISVSLLLELLATGMTVKEIVKNYPTLSKVSIRGALVELSRSGNLSASA